MTPLWTFGVLLGAPERPLYVQIDLFWNTKKPQKSIHGVQNALYPWWPPRWSIRNQIWSLWAIWWFFSGTKRPDMSLSGASKRLALLVNWHFGVSRGGPKVYKWVNDALTVHIGQLDNYVVFKTKSGAFQRGTKCSIRVKQTPLDRYWPTLDPPKPLGTPPKLFHWPSLQLM